MVGRLALTAVLSICLAAPAAAEAGTLSREGNTVVFTDTGASTANDVHVYFFTSDGAHFIRDDNGAITDAGSGCQLVVADYRCPSVDAFRIVTGGGDDTVDGRPTTAGTESSRVPLIVDLGDGLDQANGGTAGDDLQGGPENDTLAGENGNDLLDGGPGRDIMDGAAGADTASYALRTEAVTVDLGAGGFSHGSNVDGTEGDRDLIDVDVEVIVGGSGADVLKAGPWSVTLRGGAGGDSITGASGMETLDGGAGADTLDALGGPDTVLGGPDVDTVEARDGAVDTVDCGPGADNLAADPFDAATSCEPTEPGPIRETIRDTTVLPSRVLFDLAYTFTAGRRGTTLRNLAVEVEPGSRLAARCRTRRGRRCARTRDFTRAGAAVAVRLRRFEGRRLPVGAQLRIQVTKPGTIGVVKTLTIRRRRAPSVRTLCIPPGASAPAAC